MEEDKKHRDTPSASRRYYLICIVLLVGIIVYLSAYPFVVERMVIVRRGGVAGSGGSSMLSYLGDDVPGCDINDAPSFWGMGVTVSTDKVTLPESHIAMSHTYQFPYERWLRPVRCKPLKFLEIGLGCGMPYRGANGGYAATTEGHSTPLWMAFLPYANITVIEFDANCAFNFMANDPLKLGPELKRRVKMFGGDQSKEGDLLHVMKQPGVGMQDIIIDDGGHSMMQQLTTLRTLMPWVNPGGFLILEDLQSTYSWMDPNWHDNGKVAKMVEYIKEMISGLTWPEYAQNLDKEKYPGLVELLPLVKSIECYSELCVFQRWGKGEWPAPIPMPERVDFEPK